MLITMMGLYFPSRDERNLALQQALPLTGQRGLYQIGPADPDPLSLFLMLTPDASFKIVPGTNGSIAIQLHDRHSPKEPYITFSVSKIED